MLRSLVGSEMCIRDSLKPAPENMTAVSKRGNKNQPDDNNDYLDDHASACLLYTSDAADELPCVELGGSRIIKKKTTDILIY